MFYLSITHPFYKFIPIRRILTELRISPCVANNVCMMWVVFLGIRVRPDFLLLENCIFNAQLRYFHYIIIISLLLSIPAIVERTLVFSILLILFQNCGLISYYSMTYDV